MSKNLNSEIEIVCIDPTKKEKDESKPDERADQDTQEDSSYDGFNWYPDR